MAFPKTFAEMKAQGYRFDNHARCRGCEAEIEWWVTPTGKKMPMDLMPENDSPAVAHWATCKDRDSFRKG